MSAHTPGPWRVDPKHWGDVESHYGAQIALIQDTQDEHEWPPGTMLPPKCEAQANARLISAAPDLLDALETLESMPDERSIHDISNEELAAWEKARAAIAKAKGAAHE